MPQMKELSDLVHSLPRTIGLSILRIYLVGAVLLLILKIVQPASSC
jgi:hypothetical protein